MQTVNEVYQFRGLHNFPSKCGLRIFTRGTEERPSLVVILTELRDNGGTSVTNAIEELVGQLYPRVVRLLPPGAQTPDRVTWIEHYGPGKIEPDTYDLVLTPGLGKAGTAPRWMRLTETQMEQFVGAADLATSAVELRLKSVQ